MQGLGRDFHLHTQRQVRQKAEFLHWRLALKLFINRTEYFNCLHGSDIIARARRTVLTIWV